MLRGEDQRPGHGRRLQTGGSEVLEVEALELLPQPALLQGLRHGCTEALPEAVRQSVLPGLQQQRLLDHLPHRTSGAGQQHGLQGGLVEEGEGAGGREHARPRHAAGLRERCREPVRWCQDAGPRHGAEVLAGQVGEALEALQRQGRGLLGLGVRGYAIPGGADQNLHGTPQAVLPADPSRPRQMGVVLDRPHAQRRDGSLLQGAPGRRGDVEVAGIGVQPCLEGTVPVRLEDTLDGAEVRKSWRPGLEDQLFDQAHGGAQGARLPQERAGDDAAAERGRAGEARHGAGVRGRQQGALPWHRGGRRPLADLPPGESGEDQEQRLPLHGPGGGDGRQGQRQPQLQRQEELLQRAPNVLQGDRGRGQPRPRLPRLAREG
mmetsp:Transcript_27128/g.68597  ORF Transcript_27128/g.68597 Transcript_27128/m.68597 type:complete len:377 (-) Transcript_27128:376-1506(-)